jgi:hypothetical protein
VRLKTKKTEFVVIINNMPVLVSAPSSTDRINIGLRHSVILEGKEVRDGDMIARDLFDLVVKDWGNKVAVPPALSEKLVLEDVLDDDGEPLACTRENKLGIYDSDDTMFVYQVLGALAAKEKELAEAEMGNSKPGPTGD